jgi:putative transposase
MRLHLPVEIWNNIFQTVEVYCINPEIARRALQLKEATFYRKKAEYYNGGIRPRRPGSGRRRIYNPKDYVEMIDKIYEELNGANPLIGHRMIWVKMRKQGVPFSRNTAYRILDALGMNSLKPTRKGSPPSKPDEPTEPCKVWYGDTTIVEVGSDKAIVYGAVDACSKHTPWLMVSNDKDANATLRYYEGAFRVKPPEVMWTDNGGEFDNLLIRTYLRERNIVWKHGKKHTPTDQSYIERFFSTLKHEWLDWKCPMSIAELQKSLDEFVVWYNTKREHSSLNYEYPEVIHNGKR